MKNVLILGAKSDMAKATARLYAQKGYDLLLAARDATSLNDFANDINIRYDHQPSLLEFDVINYNSHADFYASISNKPDIVICFVGYLGQQEVAEKEFAEAELITNTNYTGIISILNIVASDFEAKQTGSIVCVSSVAGDRGRKSNYIYGASKAALTTYLSGLRNRLQGGNVHVLTVKPGFVYTAMTKHLSLPKPLTATPQAVAKDIYQAQQKNKNTLYTKWMWRWIMLVIKHIPESIFKKMNL